MSLGEILSMLVPLRRKAQGKKKLKRCRSKSRHVHSVPSPKNAQEQKEISVQSILTILPKAAAKDECPAETIHTQRKEIPPRPRDGTYLAKLWDNLYAAQSEQTSDFCHEESILEKDVRARLKDGEKPRLLLEMVKELGC